MGGVLVATLAASELVWLDTQVFDALPGTPLGVVCGWWTGEQVPVVVVAELSVVPGQCPRSCESCGLPESLCV